MVSNKCEAGRTMINKCEGFGCHVKFPGCLPQSEIDIANRNHSWIKAIYRGLTTVNLEDWQSEESISGRWVNVIPLVLPKRLAKLVEQSAAACPQGKLASPFVHGRLH